MIRRGTSKTNGVKVTFALPLEEVPQAASVVGDFNNWDPLAHPMKKRSNGTRSVSVEFAEGAVAAFRYLSDDGVWLNEPEADTNDEGNSVLTA